MIGVLDGGHRTTISFLAAAICFFSALRPASPTPPELPTPGNEAQALLWILVEEDPKKRAGAAEFLPETGKSEYVPVLANLLEDPVAGVRMRAARGLGRLGGEEAWKTLSIHLKTEEHEKVRGQLFLALQKAPAKWSTRAALHIMENIHSPLQIEALEFLSRNPPAEWTGLLTDFLNDRSASSEIRVMALGYLVKSQPPDLAETLIALREAEDPVVRGAVLEALNSRFPGLLAKKEGEARDLEENRGGRAIVVGSSALYGFYGLEILRQITGSEASMIFTGSGGLALGGGTAFLFSVKGDPIRRGPALWYGSIPYWGMLNGLWIADGTRLNSKPWRRTALLAGESLGIALGAATLHALEWTAGDATYVNASGLFGAGFGAGLQEVVQANEDRRSSGWSLAAGSTAGLALGAWTTRHVDLKSGRVPLMTFSMASGAWTGAWLPVLIENRSPYLRREGASLMGSSLGYSTGVFLAQHYQPSASDVLLATAAYADLLTLGIGIRNLAGLDPPPRVRAMLVEGAYATTLGFGILAWPRMTFGPSDDDLMFVSSLSAGWYLGWAPVLGFRSFGATPDRRMTGGVMTGVSGGLAGAVIVSQFSDVPSTRIRGFAVGETFGTSLGLGAGLIGSRRSKVQIASMLGGGLLGGALEVPFADPPRDHAWTSLIAGSSAWYGTWIPTLTYLQPTRSPRRTFLGGGLAGLGGGFFLGQISGWEGVAQRDAIDRAIWGQVLGNSAGLGTGLLTRMRERVSVSLMLGTGLAGGWAAAAFPGGHEPTRGEQSAYLLGGWFGALYGSGLSLLTYGSDTRSTDIWGGVLVGPPLGLAATALAIPTWKPKRSEVHFTGLVGGLGLTTGLGVGLLFPEFQERGVAATTMSLGLVGLQAGAKLAPRYHKAQGVELFTFLGTSYGLAQALGIAAISDASDRAFAGSAFLGSSVGCGLAVGLGQELETGDYGAVMAYTGGFWGGWIGAWSAQSFAGERLDSKTTIRSTIVLSNLGQVGTTLALLRFRADPRRMGWINVGGLAGMGLGAGLGGVAGKRGVAAGQLVGSMAGLTGATVVTSFIDWEELKTDSHGSLEDSAPLAGASGGRWLIPWHVEALYPVVTVSPLPDEGPPTPLYGIGMVYR